MRLGKILSVGEVAEDVSAVEPAAAEPEPAVERAVLAAGDNRDQTPATTSASR